MSRIIACFDFDGTIILQDSGFELLKQFAVGDWEVFDEMLEQEKISLHECMTSQFKLVKEEKQKLVDFILPNISLRDGFLHLYSLLQKHKIEVCITSAGLDFVIGSILDTFDIKTDELICAKTDFNDGINLTFPNKKIEDSLNFKDDTIISLQNRGYEVIYFGDGISDFSAIKVAIHKFVVEGSSLEKFCIAQEIEFTSFTDFHDLIGIISKIIVKD